MSTIDFQSEENRWAAEMACAEVNPHASGYLHTFAVEDVGPKNPSIYALALRILRTETKPVDPLLKRAREIVARCNEQFGHDEHAERVREGKEDDDFEVIVALAALKERGV